MICFADINWITFAKSVGIMIALAILFGIAIVVISKVFAVKKDTRIDEIMAYLPKANCGGCGHPGCEGFAKALIDGKATLDDCASTVKASKIEIANILGQSFSGGEETVAVVACSGGENCEDKYSYQGYGNCQTQEMLAGGKKACPAGCIGTGSCSAVCPSSAVQVKAGVAKVDDELCTSCGLCILTCPKKIIKRIPKSAKLYVACSTLCRGKEVMTACKTGCIACGICEKNCEYGAIHLVNNIPIIDYAKCTACYKCADKCPRKVIKKRN